jgi:hypothetical protein
MTMQRMHPGAQGAARARTPRTRPLAFRETNVLGGPALKNQEDAWGGHLALHVAEAMPERPDLGS